MVGRSQFRIGRLLDGHFDRKWLQVGCYRLCSLNYLCTINLATPIDSTSTVNDMS